LEYSRAGFADYSIVRQVVPVFSAMLRYSHRAVTLQVFAMRRSLIRFVAGLLDRDRGTSGLVQYVY